MSPFADQLLLRFMDRAFVEDLLSNKLGPAVLFNLVYQADDIELRQIEVARVPQREFAVPASRGRAPSWTSARSATGWSMPRARGGRRAPASGESRLHRLEGELGAS